MKNGLFCALVALLAATALPATAQIPDLSQNPSVFLTIDPNFPDRLSINGVTYKREDAEQWIVAYSAKYGRKDPVIVVAPREVPLGLAADVVRMARLSFDEVYGVIKGYSLDEPILFFDTNHIQNPDLLLAYLMRTQSRAERMIQPFASDLYTPPPKQLIDELTAPPKK